MRATLYETLGVPQTASDDEIRAALRRLIRRYYARARDGHGNVEEALRFINFTSRILGNPELRQRYDEELAADAGGDPVAELERVLAGGSLASMTASLGARQTASSGIDTAFPIARSSPTDASAPSDVPVPSAVPSPGATSAPSTVPSPIANPASRTVSPPTGPRGESPDVEPVVEAAPARDGEPALEPDVSREGEAARDGETPVEGDAAPDAEAQFEDEVRLEDGGDWNEPDVPTLPGVDTTLEPPLLTNERIPHTGLAQPMGHFGRSRYAHLAVLVALLIFAGVVVWLAIPSGDLVGIARTVLVAATAVLVVVAAAYAVVHLVSMRRRRAAPPTVPPQTDLAVFNWRREHTVFLGTEKPVEDASWVFQLRMAELERAQSRRTSEPRPWRRLAARMLDYALWGGFLAVAIRATGVSSLLPAGWAEWIAHPLIAPVLLTGSWVPVEAALGTYLGTTPGKSLLSVYLQFAISDAYADRGESINLRRWLLRAARVWVRGMGCGFPLAAPFTMSIASERLRGEQETSWDYDGDCLVTQGGVRPTSAVIGATGLAAATWFFALAWSGPMLDLLTDAGRYAAGWLHRVDELPRSAATQIGDKARELRVAAGLRLGSPADPSVQPDATANPETPAAAGAQAMRAGSAAARANASVATAERGAAPSVPTSAAKGEARVGVTGGDRVPGGPDEAQAAIAVRDRTLARAVAEGQRGLREGNPARAERACAMWTELEPSNVEAWRCYGVALNGVGRHREAVTALRRAAALAPEDAALKAAIVRTEAQLLAQFRNRYGGEP